MNKNTIPLSVLMKDKDDTTKDLMRLDVCIDSLELFIYDSAGEDRSYWKVTVMKLKFLRQQGQELLDKINAYLEANKELQEKA